MIRPLAALALGALLLGAAPARAEVSAPPAPPWRHEVEKAHPLVGRIWDPAAGAFIQPAELVERMAGAQMVLLGEKHDNADHHRLQAWALGELVESGRKPAVAFEMFDRSQAPALLAYFLQYERDISELPGYIGWDKGWGDWDFYRPMVETAVFNDLTVATANLAPDEARTLARGGEIDAKLTRDLELDRPTEPRVAEGLAVEIRESHCDMLPESALPGMVRTQWARDAIMARSMLAAAADKDDGAVLIAGAGHARRDRGVPFHLARIAPGTTVFALALLEVEADSGNPEDYRQFFEDGDIPYDAVWFTPRVDNDDPCEMMAEQMRRMKR